MSTQEVSWEFQRAPISPGLCFQKTPMRLSASEVSRSKVTLSNVKPPVEHSNRKGTDTLLKIVLSSTAGKGREDALKVSDLTTVVLHEDFVPILHRALSFCSEQVPKITFN
jgi:hypothetical protein